MKDFNIEIKQDDGTVLVVNTDMIEEMSDLQKNSILEQIQIQMQKKRMEEEEQKRQVIQVN